MYKPTADWQERVTHTLIEAGPAGLMQSEIYRQVENTIDAKHMINYLMFLEAQGKVQRFVVDPTNTFKGGRVFTIWRATTKILEP